MSFRLFIYYCAAWGAAAAYFGWVMGRLIEGDSALGGAALRGLSLGLFAGPGPRPGGRAGHRLAAEPDRRC